MKRSRLAGACIVFLTMASCRLAEWGDPRLKSRIENLPSHQIQEATIGRDRSEIGAGRLEEGTARQLVAQIAALSPAVNIGWQGEPWEAWRIIWVKTRTGEKFRITVATRPSLRGQPIVILEETSESGMGFYLGNGFSDWLQRVEESKALGDDQVAPPT